MSAYPPTTTGYLGISRELEVKLYQTESPYTVEDVRNLWRAYCASVAPVAWRVWLLDSNWLDN